MAVRKARGLNAVRDGDHPVPPLAFQQQAHRRWVQVTSVADGLAVHATFQHGAHDGRAVLVEQPHGVEGVGGGRGAVGDGAHRRLIIGTGVADGHRDFL